VTKEEKATSDIIHAVQRDMTRMGITALEVRAGGGFKDTAIFLLPSTLLATYSPFFMHWCLPQPFSGVGHSWDKNSLYKDWRIAVVLSLRTLKWDVLRVSALIPVLQRDIERFPHGE